VDKVTLSGRARTLEDVRRAALAVPDAREEVVLDIRRALARGEVVPDSHKIAVALFAQGVLT
jgi:hypothetical protein